MKFVQKNSLELGEVILPDLFILNYMPQLESIDVKIYLYIVFLDLLNNTPFTSQKELLAASTLIFCKFLQVWKLSLPIAATEAGILKLTILLTFFIAPTFITVKVFGKEYAV